MVSSYGLIFARPQEIFFYGLVKTKTALETIRRDHIKKQGSRENETMGRYHIFECGVWRFYLIGAWVWQVKYFKGPLPKATCRLVAFWYTLDCAYDQVLYSAISIHPLTSLYGFVDVGLSKV